MSKSLKTNKFGAIFNISELLVIPPSFIVVVLDFGRINTLLHQKVFHLILMFFRCLRFHLFMANEPLGVILVLLAHGLLGSHILLVLIDVVHIIKLLAFLIKFYASLFHYILPWCSPRGPLVPRYSWAASRFRLMIRSDSGNHPLSFESCLRSTSGSFWRTYPTYLSSESTSVYAILIIVLLGLPSGN